MSLMLTCREYAEITKASIKSLVEKTKKKPLLVIIQIDNDDASNRYTKWKKLDCDKTGIKCLHTKINSENYDEEDLITLIQSYDCDSNVHGIIIQLPIPKKYNLERLQNCISPIKDVDGFRRDSMHKPCTAQGIKDWLDANDYNLEGKEVVVLNRSKVVGKPFVDIAIESGATVTCCNSKTRFPELYMQKADLVVSAIGKPKFFDASDFDYGVEIVVDVGINEDANGNLCGDIDREDVITEYPNIYVTPVPGGVGLLTRTALLTNVMKAFFELEPDEINNIYEVN